MQKFIVGMEKVIKCDFKPGSIERSIDLDQEGIPQQEAIVFKCRYQ
jgi:hypothetical protein